MIKQKFIGLLIIIIGALPFLLKIESIGDFFNNYEFLSIIMPGEIGYQLLIILLGAWLVFGRRRRVEVK